MKRRRNAASRHRRSVPFSRRCPGPNDQKGEEGMRIVRTIGFALILSVLAARGHGVYTQAPAAQGSPSSTRFQIEGASIGDVHRAIQRGQITCRGVVEAYRNAHRHTTAAATSWSPRTTCPAICRTPTNTRRRLPRLPVFQLARRCCRQGNEGDAGQTSRRDAGRIGSGGLA